MPNECQCGMKNGGRLEKQRDIFGISERWMQVEWKLRFTPSYWISLSNPESIYINIAIKTEELLQIHIRSARLWEALLPRYSQGSAALADERSKSTSMSHGPCLGLYLRFMIEAFTIRVSLPKSSGRAPDSLLTSTNTARSSTILA